MPKAWASVHRVGFISIPGCGHTYRLEQVLDLMAPLAALSDSEGFSTLLKNFENPTQITATVFETTVAAFCLGRTQHRDLVLGPEIQNRNGRLKRPDFLWRTTQGEFYGECKEIAFMNPAARRLLDGVMGSIKRALGGVEIPPDKRLELEVRYFLNSTVSLLTSTAVDLIKNRTSGKVTFENCSAELVPRTADIASRVDVVTQFSVTVSTKPVKLGHENAHMSCSLFVGANRARRMTRVVQAARQQLSPVTPNILFVRMPAGAAVEAADRITAEVTSVDLPMIAMWGLDGPHTIVYREDHHVGPNLLDCGS